MKHRFNRIVERLGPAILVLAVFSIVFTAPGVPRANGAGFPMDQGAWYDPADWFIRGGPLWNEADWYHFTYNWGEDMAMSSPHGYFPGTYGYYGEEGYGLAPEIVRGLEHNYYTKDWFYEGNDFADWSS